MAGTFLPGMAGAGCELARALAVAGGATIGAADAVERAIGAAAPEGWQPAAATFNRSATQHTKLARQGRPVIRDVLVPAAGVSVKGTAGAGVR